MLSTPTRRFAQSCTEHPATPKQDFLLCPTEAPAVGLFSWRKAFTVSERVAIGEAVADRLGMAAACNPSGTLAGSRYARARRGAPSTRFQIMKLECWQQENETPYRW